jgi:hypothetical protein
MLKKRYNFLKRSYIERFSKNDIKLFIGIAIAVLLGFFAGKFSVEMGINSHLFYLGINLSAGLISGLLIGAIIFKDRSLANEKLPYCLIALVFGISFAVSISHVHGAIYPLLYEIVYLIALIAGIYFVYFCRNFFQK